MNKHDYDLAIIGGGPAGVTAALRAKELHAGRVVLIERDTLGGTCTNDGCVPMRVLAKAARLIRDARQWNHFGLGDAKPALAVGELMARVQSVIAAMHDKKVIAHRLQTAGVDLAIGRGAARFVDAHTLAIGDTGDTITAAKILICAGGHAVRPPFPGAELAQSHSDLWNLETVPKRVLIAGASATGCQAASILRAFGAEQVTLMETAPKLLPQEDAFVSEVVTAGFENSGIRVFTGTEGVSRIEKTGDALAVTIDCGNNETETVFADFVLLCVGWKANLDPLCLDAAHIETEHGYVSVDDTLRSVSAPHVFAAGDINGRLMLVQTATEQACIAAENAVRGTRRKDKQHIVPHGGFTEPEYASVGLTEEKAREAEPDCVAAVAHLHEMDRAVIDGRTVGGCKLIVSRHTHHVLGAHIAGEEATEIIHLCAGVMAGGLTVDALARLELAYPTYSAVVGRAAHDVCRTLDLIPCASDETGEACAAEWEFGAPSFHEAVLD